MKTKDILTAILLLTIAGMNAMAQGRKDSDPKNGKSYDNGKVTDSRARYSHPVNPDQNARNMEIYRQPERVRERREFHEGYQTIRHGGRDYLYNGTSFHIFSNGRYIPVVPPVGLRIRILPPDHIRIVVGRDVYFYNAGIFFAPYRNDFVIIEPPIGAVIYDLPFNAYRVKIRGRIYYEWHGTLFRRIHTKYGAGFIVVGTRHML